MLDSLRRLFGIPTVEERGKQIMQAIIDAAPVPSASELEAVKVRINQLEPFGIRLTDEIAIDDFVRFHGGDGIHESNAALLLAMGVESSQGVLDLDFECIESEQTYAHILQSIEKLTRDNFRISNVSCKGLQSDLFYRVSFDCNGQVFNLQLRADDDWLDPEIFSFFQEQSEKTGMKERFFFVENGQSSLFVFVDPKDIESLSAWAGIEFSVWQREG